MGAQLCEYTKNHFKWMNSMIRGYISIKLLKIQKELKTACKAVRVVQLLMKLGD